MIAARTRTWLWMVAAGVALTTLLAVEGMNARTLNQMLLYAPGIDKVLHTLQSCLFFLLLFQLSGLFMSEQRRRLICAALGALLLAGFDEVLQQFVPGRHVEIADILAGAGGIALGAGLLLRRQAPRAAAVTAACALVLAGAVTFESYLKTKDFNRGLLMEGQGRFAEARRFYVKAVAAGVSTANLYNSLAWVEVESGEGDPGRAVEYAERSLSMRPDDPDTLDTYGWALSHAGRTREALAALERAFAAKPSIYCIHYHLGYVHLQLGDIATARRHLQQQLQAAPDTREAQRARDLLARLGESARAGR